MIPKASEDLYGYKRWLESLTAYPVGTVFCWTAGYQDCTVSSSIKPGQFTKIVRVRKSNGVSDMPIHNHVYDLVLCDKNGKEFKKKLFWRVSAIARHVAVGHIAVLTTEEK